MKCSFLMLVRSNMLAKLPEEDELWQRLMLETIILPGYSSYCNPRREPKGFLSTIGAMKQEPFNLYPRFKQGASTKMF